MAAAYSRHAAPHRLFAARFDSTGPAHGVGHACAARLSRWFVALWFSMFIPELSPVPAARHIGTDERGGAGLPRACEPLAGTRGQRGGQRTRNRAGDAGGECRRDAAELAILPREPDKERAALKQIAALRNLHPWSRWSHRAFRWRWKTSLRLFGGISVLVERIRPV